MTTAGSLDAPIEIFGGLVTDMSPADLPHGVSPDCQDVIFSSGNVMTRPGLQALFGPLAGNPTINYVKTYETLNATLRTMLLDSNGVLYKETTPGTLASVASGLAANSYANSTTLFGREFLAVSDGRVGNDLPRQFDDTNFDCVSQSGPGGAPSVIDENVVVAVAASPTGATQPAAVTIAASPTGAVENGFLVTITTSAPHGLSAGQSVTVSGVGVASYNGTSKAAGNDSAATQMNAKSSKLTERESGAPQPSPSAKVPEPSAKASSPSAPEAQAVIPIQDLKPLYDFALDCKACQAKLSASQADLADEKTKTATLTKERDQALTVAKGGSTWRRIGCAAKWFVLGAAAGAIAARAAH